MPKVPSTARVGYSDVSYNPKAARYVNGKTGRFLSPERVREIVDEDIEHRNQLMQRIGQRLANGEINDAEFTLQMREHVKAIHLVSVAAGRGGFHNMNEGGYSRLGGLLPEHYRALQRFSADIRNGAYGDPMDAKAIERRIEAYAQAGRGSFAQSRDSQVREAGFKTRWNKLDKGSKHCSGENSCLAMTALGKVSIDDPRYLLEGSRKCIFQCKCETMYGMAAPE